MLHVYRVLVSSQPEKQMGDSRKTKKLAPVCPSLRKEQKGNSKARTKNQSAKKGVGGNSTIEGKFFSCPKERSEEGLGLGLS